MGTVRQLPLRITLLGFLLAGCAADAAPRAVGSSQTHAAAVRL